jgi:hypothetical protein
MKRIILFRFHERAEVCRNRLDLLKRHNPDTAIYGLYGGGECSYPKVEHSLGPEFAHLCRLRGRSGKWHWLNGDLAVREWHQIVGREVEFDVLHVVQWDLLLLDALEKIYSGIPTSGIGLTGLVPIRSIDGVWFWTRESWWVSHWKRLLVHSRQQYGYSAEPYASMGPGLCLPKAFLDAYASCEVPELCHDEVRLPLFAQNLGFNLYDANFCRAWFDARENIFFNCSDQEIDPEVIRNELQDPQGRRAFHPYRRLYFAR